MGFMEGPVLGFRNSASRLFGRCIRPERRPSQSLEANKVADVAKEVDRAEQLSPSREPDLEQWEDRVEGDIRKDPKIPDTEAEAIIQARVGQGRFRANVQGVERACRVRKAGRSLLQESGISLAMYAFQRYALSNGGRKLVFVPHPPAEPLPEPTPRILEVRGQRVLLDSDLAVLYGVTTKRLNEQVRRNGARFPPDFILELSNQELAILRSQFATLRFGHGQHRKHPTLAFTEHGAIMGRGGFAPTCRRPSERVREGARSLSRIRA